MHELKPASTTNIWCEIQPTHWSYATTPRPFLVVPNSGNSRSVRAAHAHASESMVVAQRPTGSRQSSGLRFRCQAALDTWTRPENSNTTPTGLFASERSSARTAAEYKHNATVAPWCCSYWFHLHSDTHPLGMLCQRLHLHNTTRICTSKTYLMGYFENFISSNM